MRWSEKARHEGWEMAKRDNRKGGRTFREGSDEELIQQEAPIEERIKSHEESVMIKGDLEIERPKGKKSQESTESVHIELREL